MRQYKTRILITGPSNSGKTRISNLLADIEYPLPEPLNSIPLRIVEFEIHDAEIGGNKVNVDVELWDTNGNDIYSSYWLTYRKHTDGVVFVYSQQDDVGVRKLDSLHNYFVMQKNLSPRACLVCAVTAKDVKAKLSSTFSKISQINVNLDGQGQPLKFKQEFQKYVASVVTTLTGTQNSNFIGNETLPYNN